MISYSEQERVEAIHLHKLNFLQMLDIPVTHTHTHTHIYIYIYIYIYILGHAASNKKFPSIYNKTFYTLFVRPQP